ncbi:MAG: CHAT domain-containing protein, partial [Leptolyngbyaceae bacterium]|nr:CHAT domain-containing protein [Leptolyngbyaceae bacterium]
GGGGIYNRGTLTLTSSIVSGNTASDRGGGIANRYSGTITLTDSTVIGNSASRNGGGISNYGTLTLSNSTVSGNSTFQHGGGISNYGSVTLSNSTVSGNSASDHGGGISNYDSVTLSNSTVSGNFAATHGGGISNFISLMLTNSTVSGNSASNHGGGISNYTSLTLTNSTVTGNSASERGGGISNYGTLTLTNSIVAGNIAPSINGMEIWNDATFLSNGVNLFGTNGNSGIVGATPAATDIVPTVGINSILAPLGNNGGPTQTHALLPGSPAIDASGAGATSTDQRGEAAVGVRDIGAYELTTPTPTPTPTPPPSGIESPTELSQIPPKERDSDPDLLPDLPVNLIVEEVSPANITTLESLYTNAYTNHGGLNARDFPFKSLLEAQQALRQIESLTGVKPALLYLNFTQGAAPSTPVAMKAKALQGGSYPQDLWQFKGTKLTLNSALASQTGSQQASVRQDNDPLELVIVTSDAKPILKRVPSATRAKVIKLADAFRAGVTDPDSQSYRVPAQQLYQLLVAPMESEFQTLGINNLVFITDAGLRSLPFAALHDGQQFLVEKYSVGMMPSFSLTDTRFVSVKNLPVLAMGASTFQEQAPLPAVPEELSIINQLWPGKSLLNEGFTLSNLKGQRQQQPYPIIHLATHGEFNAGALSNSYIQLWDTKLRLNQIRELGWSNPPVELLVLSACRTALGNEEAELGFAGLAVQSGVKSALASLWYVSDAGTLGLMNEFYQQLKTAPVKAEALRQAQLAMIQNKVRLGNGQLRSSRGETPLSPNVANLQSGDFSHPYYWSAFTMIGNPW